MGLPFPTAPTMIRKFFTAIWNHLKVWPEAYLILPLVLVAIPGAGLMVYYISGRAPMDSLEWLVDISSRVLVASLAILFTSFTKEASGFWMTKYEAFEHPYIATIQAIVKVICLVLFLWFFSH